ncbi:hypothetical protein QR680_009758 [Steinernema hermaphroditum]|uniref:Ubiquitin-like domain-containing protein n=1 Tax=Steinernema hermaphroditum TaxID=289476 RepID=A0AA39ILK2_9BILA|nr:hypothetical protein QR680_009758 [Steinernema hermaphroditum]
MQSHDDVVVSCPMNWSVKQLKEHLKAVYPSKPDVAVQRLIFYGRCLEDDRSVASYFPTKDAGDSLAPQSQVIHLVVPLKNNAELNEGLRRRNVNNASTGNQSTNNGQSQSAQAPSAGGAPSFQNNFMGMYGYAQAYAAYMQQYYQNMMMMYAHANGTQMPMQFPMAQMPTVTVHHGPLPPQVQQLLEQHRVLTQQMQGNGAQQAQPQPDPQVQPDAVPMGAGNDEPQQPRDFLALIYKAFQIGLLLMVVLTNSSMERFFAVFATIIFVWFLQNRRAQQERQQQAVPVPQPQQPEGENDEGNAAGGNAIPDGIAHDIPSAWNVFWSTCYTFISSFFLSLLPDNQVPLNGN